VDAEDAAALHSSSAPDTETLLWQSLEESRRLGFLGSRPIPEVVAHARGFVDALLASADWNSPNATLDVLDLGAGGGVPGFVIAHDLPAARLTMLDRRRTRTDFLARVVRRLEWVDRVEVLTQDAATPGPDQRASFDAVVARGFGPPETTLRIASLWTRSAGLIVISEPPTGDRWAGTDLRDYDVERVTGPGSHMAVFRKR
jgi:16S rRNA (guanine527-N7)-methyltransferase